MLRVLLRASLKVPAVASSFSSLTSHYPSDYHSFIHSLNKQPMTNLQKSYDQTFDRNPQARLRWLFSAHWDWDSNPELLFVYGNDPAPVEW